jgi:DNA polymerase-1
VKNPKAYLIDGNSLAYRAFYALPDTMKTSSGMVTNAVYGFTTMLLKLLEDEPDFLAVAFDRKEPTFRHKEYKEYKATRDKAPPTLLDQMPQVREVVEAFDIPVIELAGFEADDLIGTMAKSAEAEGFQVTIVTGDLDPLQLVNSKIKVLTTRKGISDTVVYDAQAVRERYGLEPEQLIDFKALKGDASDNIPGLPGVGEKTAAELLQKYKTLDNLFKHAEEIEKPKLKETVKKERPLAELSKKLATIVTDAPLKVNFKRPLSIDWAKALALFKKLEFDSLFKKYQDRSSEFSKESLLKRKREEIKKFSFQCVDTSTIVKKLKSAEVFAFDCETTSLDTRQAKLVGIAFSVKHGEAFYVPSPDLEELKPIFESQKLKVGHNLKYDIEVLDQQGLSVAPPHFDTMVAAYLLDPISGGYNLKKMGAKYLGRHEMIKLQELIGEEAEHGNFAEVPLDVATEYACSDADVTFGLYEELGTQLKKQELLELFEKVEMPLLKVLIDLEETGVFIDKKQLAKLSKDLGGDLKELEKQIFAIAGETFNLNSPKQLAYILFEKLKIPSLKRTKTGASTDAEVLEDLALQFEIAQKVLEYRQFTKLKSTYVDVLPELINPKTGRVHANFNQTITATGRLSSSNPNLQNIPIRGELGQKVREAFVPQKKGWMMVAADYSQIELRILAHLSQDPVLLKAFKEDQDIHQSVADELGISREAAKTVNFGIIYGISDFGLAKSLKIKKTEAGKFIDKYFERHKGVKKFIDKTIAEARENGYVTTMLGRKRPLPDINSPNYGLRSFAERTAINTPVQGTAADMIKVAMVNIKSKIKDLKSKMILQVHDELVFECPKEETDKVRKIVEQEMAKAVPLSVAVKVDTGIGESWVEAK